MKRTKKTIKARIEAASVRGYSNGYRIGFEKGQECEKSLREAILETEREKFRKELFAEARLERYRVVTEATAKLANAVGQAMAILADLDRVV